MAFVLHLVVPDYPSGRSVLLLEADTGWALPHVIAPDRSENDSL